MLMIDELVRLCLNCQNPQCVKGCPAHNNIPKIINLIKTNQFETAYNENLKTSVLPGICSRLCEHSEQCEGSCIKKRSPKFNYQPVPISSIEMFLASKFHNEIYLLDLSCKHLHVAIIGSGIAGLSAAFNLARRGAKVEIFEKTQEIGGVVKSLIPTFRFDDQIFHDYQKNLVKFDIEVYYEKELGVNLFFEDLVNYNYCLFAMGTMQNNRIFELTHPQVLLATEVLLALKKGVFKLKSQKALIIGAGNVAMDVARALQRINIDSTIVYRRTMAFSPSSKAEIEVAKAENVKFLELRSPSKIIFDKAEVKGLEVQVMKMTNHLDQSGRPVFEKTDHFELLEADLIIEAIGSKPDYNYLRKTLPELLEQSNSNLSYRNYQKYYLLGDYANGASTIVKAMSSALQATNKIIEIEEVKQ